MNETKRHSLKVSSDDIGKRLDAFVVSKMKDLSRSRIKRLIEDGFVRLDGEESKASHEVKGGESISVEIPPPTHPSAKPQDIELDVIFEDKDIIVVNKFAGMVVHPAAGHPDGTLVNALLAHCGDLSGIGGELKAGIVHRLDAGTTGVIIAAKNDAAHKSLSDQFKNRTVKKIYGALVYGSMQMDSGEFDSPLGRSRGDRKRISGHTRRGRVAHTEWSVLERFGTNFNWLEIRIRTGRTHQIRVHLTEAGHPLVGDPLYGGKRKTKRIVDENIRESIAGFDRPALHAWCLGIDHPRSGERMEFKAELAGDLMSLLNKLREITNNQDAITK